MLDELLREHPERVQALCGRGVQLARFGRRDEAVRDARAALALEQGALTLYQVACIYSLVSKQDPASRREAICVLAEWIRKDGSWLAVARTDHDLDLIRELPAFRDLVKAAEVVSRVSKGR